jgi:hypothetical protein
MSSASPAVPDWSDSGALVDPELRAAADEMTQRVLDAQRAMFELGRDAVDLLRRISESEPPDALDDLMPTASPTMLVGARDAWIESLQDRNGSAQLYAALDRLAEIMRVASEGGDVSEVAPDGPYGVARG